MDYDSKRELYKVLRGQIEHEDNLVNQRVTWLLLIQGFLFASFYNILISSLDKPDFFSLKLIILILISAFGIFISWVSLRSIRGAFKALKHIREFWFYQDNNEGSADEDNLKLENFPDKKFPDITYRGKTERLSAGVASRGIPSTLMTIWSIIIFGLCFLWYFKSSTIVHKNPQKQIDSLKIEIDSLKIRVDKLEKSK
jgi:hypothetical protein